MSKIKFLLILFFSNLAFANNKDFYYFPYVTGNVLFEYNFSRLDSNNHGNKVYEDNRNLSYLEIESITNIYLFNNFSIKTHLLFMPFVGRLDDKNQYYNDFYQKDNYMTRRNYFNRYDVIFEEFSLEFKEEFFLAGIGKFNPTFGTAHDKSKFYPVFGTKIAEDYELREKIGFYVAMTLPMFNLRGNFFYNDDSFLSGSLFRNRDRYYDDKGVGNQRKLNNFSITADIGIDDYRLNLGFRRLYPSRNSGNVHENGYLIGIERLIEETDLSFGLMPFLEYSVIKNYNGTKNRDMNYLTVRLPLFYKNWNITPSYSARLDEEDGFKDYKTYLSQISVGYKFNNGLMFDISKNLGRESYKLGNNLKNTYRLNSTDFRFSYMLILDEEN